MRIKLLSRFFSRGSEVRDEIAWIKMCVILLSWRRQTLFFFDKKRNVSEDI